MILLQPSLLAMLISTAAAQEAIYGAMELFPAGLSPRSYANAPLAKRDGEPCNAGSHRCIDVGADDQCCPNTHYCYINPEGRPRCCAIGSNCDSQCSATAFQCPTVVTTSGTAVTSSACCGRACPATSMFRCEAEFGGGCCGYGSTCASDRQCRSTRTTETAIVTAIEPGCNSTDEHACPDDDGCCLNWMHCTTVSGEGACAPGNTERGFTFVPESTGDSDNDSGGGLSTGARAGIGVGVAVVVCAVLGGLVWFCLMRRRRARQETERSPTVSQRPPPQRALGSDRSPPTLSEVTTEVTRASRLRGLTQDYFGPAATAGPYTTTDNYNSTPAATSPGTPPRGVPLTAHSPNDITAPVEIDSRLQDKDDRVVTIVRDRPAESAAHATPETTHGRFELYGSESVQPSLCPSPVADSPTYPGGAHQPQPR